MNKMFCKTQVTSIRIEHYARIEEPKDRMIISSHVMVVQNLIYILLYFKFIPFMKVYIIIYDQELAKHFRRYLRPHKVCICIYFSSAST